jgi:seryl-tRNA synthetase
MDKLIEIEQKMKNLKHRHDTLKLNISVAKAILSQNNTINAELDIFDDDELSKLIKNYDERLSLLDNELNDLQTELSRIII